VEKKKSANAVGKNVVSETIYEENRLGKIFPNYALGVFFKINPLPLRERSG
jgi:hypothetical protein